MRISVIMQLVTLQVGDVRLGESFEIGMAVVHYTVISPDDCVELTNERSSSCATRIDDPRRPRLRIGHVGV